MKCAGLGNVQLTDNKVKRLGRSGVRLSTKPIPCRSYLQWLYYIILVMGIVRKKIKIIIHWALYFMTLRILHSHLEIVAMSLSLRKKMSRNFIGVIIFLCFKDAITISETIIKRRISNLIFCCFCTVQTYYNT